MTVSSVQEYFSTLGRRFQSQNAADVDAIFQFELAGAGTTHVVVKAGTMTIVEGAHPSPTVTIKMNGDDYVKMANGALDGRMAFMTGKMKVAGQIPMAMKMQQLFPAGPIQ